MASNRIQKLYTTPLESANGTVLAIMMALDVFDLERTDEFIQSAIEKFKAQRMCSPPETSVLLVTIVGAMSAEDFAQRWKAIASTDKVFHHFMSQLETAEVLHGTSAGQVLDTASLRL